MGTAAGCTGRWCTKSRSLSRPAVSYYAAEIAGQFRMELTPAEGHTLDEVEEAAEEVLASIAADPPTEEEFERAINRIEMQHYRTLSRVGGFGGRADALNYFNVFTGDPDRLNRVMDDYRKVTREDVLRAHSLIMDSGLVRMRVHPEQSADDDFPVCRSQRSSPTAALPPRSFRPLPNGVCWTTVWKSSSPTSQGFRWCPSR